MAIAVSRSSSARSNWSGSVFSDLRPKASCLKAKTSFSSRSIRSSLRGICASLPASRAYAAISIAFSVETSSGRSAVSSMGGNYKIPARFALGTYRPESSSRHRSSHSENSYARNHPTQHQPRQMGSYCRLLSNLPADATLIALSAAIKARWVCEQAHQQIKEERPRPLRRPIMARDTPARPDHDDRLRTPPAPEIADCKAGKKGVKYRRGRLSPYCLLSVELSSAHSPDQ